MNPEALNKNDIPDAVSDYLLNQHQGYLGVLMLKNKLRSASIETRKEILKIVGDSVVKLFKSQNDSPNNHLAENAIKLFRELSDCIKSPEFEKQIEKTKMKVIKKLRSI